MKKLLTRLPFLIILLIAVAYGIALIRGGNRMKMIEEHLFILGGFACTIGGTMLFASNGPIGRPQQVDRNYDPSHGFVLILAGVDRLPVQTHCRGNLVHIAASPQPHDDRLFHQLRETLVAVRPRNRHLLDLPIPVFHARNARLNNRFKLTSVQMPPSPLRPLVRRRGLLGFRMNHFVVRSISTLTTTRLAVMSKSTFSTLHGDSNPII